MEAGHPAFIVTECPPRYALECLMETRARHRVYEVHIVEMLVLPSVAVARSGALFAAEFGLCTDAFPVLLVLLLWSTLHEKSVIVAVSVPLGPWVSVATA